jgi:hypothetical protein
MSTVLTTIIAASVSFVAAGYVLTRTNCLRERPVFIHHDDCRFSVTSVRGPRPVLGHALTVGRSQWLTTYPGRTGRKPIC